jgi:GntR family transcriptional regulator, transcriptional repressor for pyruvate dehydrogenase complex
METITFPNRTTLTEDVMQYLLTAIKNGNISPGEKLPSERELSMKLEVSRSCVREALQALAVMRVIDIRPGRGAYIRGLLPEDVLDTSVLSRLIKGDTLVALVETRMILEVGIARLAAERRTEDQLRSIEQIFEVLDLENLTVEEILAYDLEFHSMLANATNNPVLVKLYQTIVPLLADSRTKVNLIPGARDKAWIFHRLMYEAVKNKDGEAARQHMIRHLEDLWEDLNQYIEEVSASVP